MRISFLLLLIGAIALLTNSAARSQPPVRASVTVSDSSAHAFRSEEILPAYGFRFGVGRITTVGSRGIIEAFYDVPMGTLFLTPELVFYAADNFSYGFNVKLKGRLSEGELWNSYLDGGIQFMVWLDRAHIGLPLDYSVTYNLNSVFALEATANYTPIYTLGVRPDDSVGHYSSVQHMFGVKAGIRITVR